MRRIAIVSMLAAVILLPAVVLAHGGTTITVRGDARVLGGMEVVGEGFAANDVVRIELRKSGMASVELGRVPADAAGAFTQTLHVPASVSPGIYELAASGQESATAEVTILAAAGAATDAAATSAPVTNRRPGAETAALAGLSAAVALAGLGLLRLSRMRPRSRGA